MRGLLNRDRKYSKKTTSSVMLLLPHGRITVEETKPGSSHESVVDQLHAGAPSHDIVRSFSLGEFSINAYTSTT